MSLLRELIDRHRAQLFGVVEVRGVGRLRRLYADSREELEEKLRRLARAGRGDTFQAQHLRAVLAQVADAAGVFQGKLTDHMTETGRVAAQLAPKHLAHMVGTLEEQRGQLTPVIQAAQAAVVRGVYPNVASTLIEQHKRSAKLYGPQTVGAIREGLARSIVQAESVDEAVDRVVGAEGLFARQRWRAERIVRTETAWSYGVSKQRSLEELRPAVPAMMKRLVATFDDRTGEDSEELNGQTVPVDQPFVWRVLDARGHPTGKVVRYMQPPNRPNDREIVIPWVAGWSEAGLARPGPVDPSAG